MFLLFITKNQVSNQSVYCFSFIIHNDYIYYDWIIFENKKIHYIKLPNKNMCVYKFNIQNHTDRQVKKKKMKQKTQH